MQTVILVSSNSDTLVDLAVTVYPIHIYYEEEWWKPYPCPSSTPGERLWFNACDTNTNFWV